MFKTQKISTLLILSIFLFSACNTGQQKQKDEGTESKEEVSAELTKKHNELKELAGDELSLINEKILELNSKIEEQEGGLTDKQNELLDQIQEKRMSVNERLNKIENVTEEEWDAFQKSFETDLKEIQSKLDEVLDDF